MQQMNRIQPWVNCFTAALFFFYEFMQMNIFNAIIPGLMHAFTTNALQIGSLSAWYFYGTVLFLFPAGILLDHFPTKKLILIAMSVSVTGTILFALAPTLGFAKFCRFLSGMGGSFAFLSCLRLVSLSFPPQRLALATGLMITFAMTGGIIAQTPMTLLVEAVNWRHALLIYAVAGILFIVIIQLNLRNLSGNLRLPTSNPSMTLSNLRKNIKISMTNKQTWLGGLYTCLMNLPVPLLGGVWGSLYLVNVSHLSRAQASYVTTMLFVGIIIGSPLVGWISGRLATRKLPMIVGSLFALMDVLVLIYYPNSELYVLMLLFLGLGIFSSCQTIGYPIVAESNPKSVISTAMSVATILIMGGAGLAQPLFGWLIDFQNKGTSYSQINSLQNYQLAISMLPIAFVIGFAIAIIIKETYNHVLKET